MTPGSAGGGDAGAAGAGSGEADLWCTYAAVRTLSWLDRPAEVTDRDRTAGYLRRRRNPDGGYGWSRGMASDAWATFYCTQALADLGHRAPRPEATGDWLRRTWSGAAYAMQPGQSPDVWATHFSTRTVAEVCGGAVPDRPALLRWLAALQCASGGLSWTPGDAERGAADVRAGHYAAAAWRSAGAGGEPPWAVDRLVAWLRGQQDPDGGFRLSASAGVPCMWATYRAVAALAALGAAPARPQACVAWVCRQRGESGAFVRWPGYQVEDVWASFCAVGTMRALGAPTAPVADAVVRRVAALACPGGGYTYREPAAAADVLSTAALALRRPAGDPRTPALRRWLDGCQLPNEGGLMYMPGRGGEVRSTLWALAAGALAGNPAGRVRVGHWLRDLQNPDGGFGYWQGRASDLVSTASAVEIVGLLGRRVAELLDPAGVLRFADSCGGPAAGHGNVPGAAPTLRAGLQAYRIQHALGRDVTGGIAALLARHRVRGGGFADQGDRLPDLLSTFEAVLTADRAGLPFDAAGCRRFLDRVTDAAGTGWTPLAPGRGGPLADCLGELLCQRLTGARDRLPALALS